MNEVKYFIIFGKVQEKPKKVGIRALCKPSIPEATKICEGILDEVNGVEETTEDFACYSGI